MSRRKKSRFVQRLEYAAYRAVAALVRRSSERSVRRWGARLGTLARRLLRRRDALAMRNLEAAFPDRDAASLRATLDECWRHFGRETLAYIRTQTTPFDELVARCTFIRKDIFDDAIARGKGVVFISAHYGAWEVGGLVIASMLDDVVTVARKLDNEILEEDLVRLRARTGAAVVDRRKAARPLMKALGEGAVVVMLPDQAVQPREGVLVPFLGRPAWTTDAPAKMALRTGSTIVFAFCIPAETGHRIEFEESVPVEELSEGERDPVALTARINAIISRRIADRPELWLWMHDRWKATGGSEADGE
jgi:KDO2-lipid IV(A) lauroyltransferase